MDDVLKELLIHIEEVCSTAEDAQYRSKQAMMDATKTLSYVHSEVKRLIDRQGVD